MSLKSKLKENKGFIALLLGIIAVKSSVIDWNFVPTGSMRPTLADGDQIVINKLAYDITFPLTHISLHKFDDPKRGDIIVFDSESENLRMVKRVIGVPGDHIVLVNNELTVNGNKASYEDFDSEDIQHTFKKLDDASLKYYQENNVKIENLPVDYKLETVEGIPAHPVRMELGFKLPSILNVDIIVPEDKYFVIGDNRNNSRDSRFWGFVERNEIVGKVNNVVFSLDQSNWYIPRGNRFFKGVE